MRIKTLLLPSFIIIFSLFLLFIACQKNNNDETNNNHLNTELSLKAARKFFYQQVKPQFLTASPGSRFNRSAGRMYPFWQKAYEAKSKFNEYVEVPIFYERKSGIRIASDNKGSNQSKVSADIGSFDRLIIYRTSTGAIYSRQITYIPDNSYLKNHNNDVSHNQIGNLDKDFKGYLLYRNIYGRIDFVLKIENGKAVKKMIPAKGKVTRNSGARVTDNCDYPYIEHWLQDCVITAPDGPNGPQYEECDEWYIDWIEYLDPVCEEDEEEDPCLNPVNFCLAECGGNDDCGGGGGGNQNEGGAAYIAAALEYEDHIDRSDLDTNDCAQYVYDLLISTHTMYSSVRRFMGDYPVTHLDWDIKPLSGSNAQTVYDPATPYVITIEINSSYLSSATPTSVARTMLHEAIHAEMYRKMISVGWIPGTTPPGSSDFPGLFDYYTRYSSTGNAQHNMMAAHYRDKIIQGLKEFDSLHGSVNTASFYEAMSWAGLYGTTPYMALSAATRASYESIINSQTTGGGCP